MQQNESDPSAAGRKQIARRFLAEARELALSVASTTGDETSEVLLAAVLLALAEVVRNTEPGPL